MSRSIRLGVTAAVLAFADVAGADRIVGRGDTLQGTVETISKRQIGWQLANLFASLATPIGLSYGF